LITFNHASAGGKSALQRLVQQQNRWDTLSSSEDGNPLLTCISHHFSRTGFEGAESLDSDGVLKAFVEKPPVDEPA